jgi:CheY-like chemotaxis protein
VLILEDEEHWRYVLARTLTDRGYRVTTANSAAAAEALLVADFFHLLVLDISMREGDRLDRGGMDFLRRLQDARQGEKMPTLVVSGFGDVEKAQEAFHDYHVENFLDKSALDPARFMREVESTWTRAVRINLDLGISWMGVQGASEACLQLRIGDERVRPGTPLQEQMGAELEDLLCRLFHDAEGIIVEPMERGKGGTGVLKVVPFYPSLGQGQAMVVKFGDADEIAIESQRFEKYVRRMLGQGRSARVEEARRTHRLGGISYSLLGAGRFENLGAYIRRHELPDIEKVLDNLFRETCGGWYANLGNLQRHNLTADYEELLSLKAESLEAPLRKGLKRVQGTERLHFGALAGDRTFLNPVLVISGRAQVASTYVCTTHGDLNPENVLVDTKGSTWLIDFRRTGRGHCLRDFAELDACLRILLLAPEEATLDDRLRLEQELLRAKRWSDLDKLSPPAWPENPALVKAFVLAAHLRRLAHRQVSANPSDDIGEYYVASLYMTLNLIRFWDLDVTLREHALLSAALLAESLGL